MALSWTDEEMELVRRLWKRGASDTQIAQELTQSIRPRGREAVRSFRERVGFIREASTAEPNVVMNDAYVRAMERAGYPLGTDAWGGDVEGLQAATRTVPHRSLPSPMSYGSGWQA